MDIEHEIKAMGEQHGWLELDQLDWYSIQEVAEHGCSGGSYMPAVVYHKAVATMAEHGDEIWEYLEDMYGEVPKPCTPQYQGTWSRLCVFYVSAAVECWCSEAVAHIQHMEEQKGEEYAV